jgi:hypothetical protein
MARGVLRTLLPLFLPLASAFLTGGPSPIFVPSRSSGAVNGRAQPLSLRLGSSQISTPRPAASLRARCARQAAAAGAVCVGDIERVANVCFPPVPLGLRGAIP